MYRKVISVVFVLGLMTLVVSAQQPATNGQKEGAGRSAVGVPPADPTKWAERNYTESSTASFGHAVDFFGRQNQDLVRQFSKAKGEDREKLKAKLTEALEKQFDARQKRHQEQLAALEMEVRKLKELVQKRQENRREIVTRRFDELVRDAEGLGW
jgi:DNA anti-recombination protein RmuC